MRPWLYLPSHFTYQFSPFFLKALSLYYKQLLPLKNESWASFSWKGISFKNPLGFAPGWNKNGNLTQDLWNLGGMGFMEIGTLTPRPQKRNPGKVVSCDRKNECLWNHLGFPNEGLDFVCEIFKKISRSSYFTPLFFNVGKNRETDLKTAAKDYTECIKKLHFFADAFVINISSPNTPKLKKLSSQNILGDFLSDILNGIREEGKSLPPLLVKLAPDYKEKDFERILQTTYELGIDGWVVTNTLPLHSSGVLSPPKNSKDFFFDLYKYTRFRSFKKGGLSGRPLQSLSLKRLEQTVNFVKKNSMKSKEEKRLIVSVGGVLSPEDVFKRLEMGADLVEAYSAFVLKGPWFFRQVCKEAALKFS